MAKFCDNVSEEDRNKIIKVCNQYLGGIWRTKNIVIQRFSSGYFNRIFHCELKTETNGLNDYNRRAVVVKLALEEEFFLYKPLNSVINTLVISETKLAPKVLGVFPGGLINQYIESRSYNHLDDENPVIVTLLAKKLANFHRIKAPIARDGTNFWMDRLFGDFFDGNEFQSINDLYNNVIKNSSFESLKSLDFKGELIWVRDAIISADKILVYSHCDFNRGNILIKQFNQSFEIFFIDFDFTSNNFRGIDFGRYFSSWRQKDPNFGFGEFPTDHQMSTFIDAYIEESNRLTDNEFSKSKLNSKQHLIKEAKLFTLVGVIIDVFFCLFKASVEDNSEGIQDFLTKGEQRNAFYFKLKNKFKKEQSLPKGFNF